LGSISVRKEVAIINPLADCSIVVAAAEQQRVSEPDPVQAKNLNADPDLYPDP
jgi:hypothetical protein